MNTKGTLAHKALAAGAAFALLTGCGQEKKEDASVGYDPVDPLSLPLGDKQASRKAYNTNIPPVDELKKQYKAAEAKRMADLKPKIQYAYNKLYKPFTVYPQTMSVPQLPKSQVTFARNPASATEPKVVLLNTRQESSQIEAYYADKLKREGWQCVAQKGNTAYHEVVAIKGKEQMTVTIYIGIYGDDERVVRIETKPRRGVTQSPS